MKKVAFFISCFLLISCNNNELEKSKSDTVVVIKASAVSEIREKPNSAPVANYSVAVEDGVNYANGWKFSASLFETKYTFRYLLKMQYKELRETDTLIVPNLGILPKVVIQKGESPQSCIIGFYDKKGSFKEYKKLIVRNEQLKLITVQSYSVGVVRSKLPFR
jgi:hypothetical protein